MQPDYNSNYLTLLNIIQPRRPLVEQSSVYQQLKR